MHSSDIIAAFGGYTALAVALGCSRTAVFNWLKVGIPAQRWKQLAELAERRGLHKPFKDASGKRHPGITLLVLSEAAPAPERAADPAAPPKVAKATAPVN